MKHATLFDLKEIYAQFRKRKDMFPHVRQDKLRRMIEAGQVVWQCTLYGPLARRDAQDRVVEHGHVVAESVEE